MYVNTSMCTLSDTYSLLNRQTPTYTERFAAVVPRNR